MVKMIHWELFVVKVVMFGVMKVVTFGSDLW